MFAHSLSRDYIARLHIYTIVGYFDIPGCFQAGMCGERSCPELCLCCESFWCLGPSMSSRLQCFAIISKTKDLSLFLVLFSRLYIMDMYDLRPDPCDNRVVRFTNCLMCCSCMLDFISMFVPPLRDLARTVHIIAECVFYSTIGCMAGQINYEVDYRAGHVGPGSNTYDESTPIIAEGKVKTGPTIGEGSVVRNPVIGEGYVK